MAWGARDHVGHQNLNETVAKVNYSFKSYVFNRAKLYYKGMHAMSVFKPAYPECRYRSGEECLALTQKKSVQISGVLFSRTCPTGIAGCCQHVGRANRHTYTTTSLLLPESHTPLQRAWGPQQYNISPQALQQVVVARAKMTRSDVDSAECTPMKRKKSATLAICIKQGQEQH